MDVSGNGICPDICGMRRGCRDEVDQKERRVRLA
jgi:hypothetical protein